MPNTVANAWNAIYAERRALQERAHEVFWTHDLFTTLFEVYYPILASHTGNLWHDIDEFTNEMEASPSTTPTDLAILERMHVRGMNAILHNVPPEVLTSVVQVLATREALHMLTFSYLLNGFRLRRDEPILSDEVELSALHAFRTKSVQTAMARRTTKSPAETLKKRLGGDVFRAIFPQESSATEWEYAAAMAYAAAVTFPAVPTASTPPKVYTMQHRALNAILTLMIDNTPPTAQASRTRSRSPRRRPSEVARVLF